MRRRQFLRAGLITGLSIPLLLREQSFGQDGNDLEPFRTSTCSNNPASGTSSNDTLSDRPIRGYQYYFRDHTGTLGHLASSNFPDCLSEAQVIENRFSEATWRDLQLNDVEYPDAVVGNEFPMSVDEIVQRTGEIIAAPKNHFAHQITEPLDIDVRHEDAEITFTRALIKASLEAGVESNGLKNAVIPNIAEYAADELPVDFTQYKLTTLPSTVSTSLSTKQNGTSSKNIVVSNCDEKPGFGHFAGFLQYERDGDAVVKFVEINHPYFIRSFDQLPSNNESAVSKCVTPLDYTTVRKLESNTAMGYRQSQSEIPTGVGNYIGRMLIELIDDIGIISLDYTLVSDRFGISLMKYARSPSPVRRWQLENLARAIFLIQKQASGKTALALTGTLGNPAILSVTQKFVSAVRRSQAYDSIRTRIAERESTSGLSRPNHTQ